MTTNDIQAARLNQQDEFSSALSTTLHVAFVAMVSVGVLTGTALVLWLLSLLAHSSYAIYFGV
jgi:hypothetical protein